METITCSMRQAPWLMNFVFWLIDWLMESEKYFMSLLYNNAFILYWKYKGIWVASLNRAYFCLCILSFVFPFSQFHFVFLFLIHILIQYLQQNLQIYKGESWNWPLHMYVYSNWEFILCVLCFLCKTYSYPVQEVRFKTQV